MEVLPNRLSLRDRRILALLAVLLLPALYAGLYLYANGDPEANLSRVPAALVVEDTGATLANGERLVAGTNAAAALVKARELDWHQVTRAEAVAGVRDERYALALVIPADFSAALISPTSADPRRATLEEIGSTGNGYLSRTLSADLVRQVSDAVADRISTTTSGQILAGFETIRTDVTWAADGSGQLESVLRQLNTGVGPMATAAARVKAAQAGLLTSSGQVTAAVRQAKDAGDIVALAAADVDRRLATLDQQTAALPEQSQRVSQAAAAAAGANATVAAAGRSTAQATTELQTARTQRLAAIGAALSAAEAANNAGTRSAPVAAAIADARLHLLGLNSDLDGVAGAVSGASGQLVDAAMSTEKVTTSATALAGAVGTIRTGVVQAHQSSGKAAAAARTTGSALGTAATQSASFGSTQAGVAGDAAQVASSATTVQTNLARAADATTKLHTRLATGLQTIPVTTPEQRKVAAQVLGSPIAIRRADDEPAWTVGAALAPLYGALGLWAGGVGVAAWLRARRRLDSDADRRVDPLVQQDGLDGGVVDVPAARAELDPPSQRRWPPDWRTIGRTGWARAAVLGAGQAALVAYLAFHGAGLRVAHGALLLGVLILVALTFAALVHLLERAFGRAGLLAALALMSLQAVCAGGLFPWQTLPTPLAALHHVLPLSYAVDAIGRLMYGGALGRVGLDAVVLLGVAVVSVALTVLTARRTGSDPATGEPDR